MVDKFTAKKKKTAKFSSYIDPLVSKKLNERIKECGDFLQMLSNLSLENSKLHRASFCGNRFCPMCSWRVSCKDSLEISILMGLFKDDHRKYQNGELDIYKELDTIEYAYRVNYNWFKNKYDNSQTRELTEEEKQKFNNNLRSETDYKEY